MKKCNKCGQEKTWSGSDIECPFVESDEFGDNWNCGAISSIRRICDAAESNNDYRLQYCNFDEQQYVCINTMDIESDDHEPGLGICLWVTWYKRRGRVEAMWILDYDAMPRIPTLSELESIYNYYKSEGIVQ